MRPGAVLPSAVIDRLPNFSLYERRGQQKGPLCRMCVAHGLRRFQAAARHVWHLPYRRNSSRAAYDRVLPEERGTCATKHAFLAALAREYGQEGVRLTLGLYTMTAANTPAARPVLARHDLAGVPEMHCYLTVGGRRVDLSWPGTPGHARLPMRAEEHIRPDQIGGYKEARHQAYIDRWAKRRRLDAGFVWRVREACIAAVEATPG